jgi:hypothetical protein
MKVKEGRKEGGREGRKEEISVFCLWNNFRKRRK